MASLCALCLLAAGTGDGRHVLHPAGMLITPGAPEGSASLLQSTANTGTTKDRPATGCLDTGNGYLRARIRGALNLDINWTNAELECDGSVRPDGSGIRLSFAGPQRPDGRRVRMVFGVAAATEGAAAHALPTNLTVIFEGEDRVFATLGDERCTVDDLRQERFGAPGGSSRTYRVVARGFCIEPATAVGHDERIVVSRFDFAGRVTYVDTSPPDGSSRKI